MRSIGGRKAIIGNNGLAHGLQYGSEIARIKFYFHIRDIAWSRMPAEVEEEKHANAFVPNLFSIRCSSVYTVDERDAVNFVVQMRQQNDLGELHYKRFGHV